MKLRASGDVGLTLRENEERMSVDIGKGIAWIHEVAESPYTNFGVKRVTLRFGRTVHEVEIRFSQEEKEAGFFEELMASRTLRAVGDVKSAAFNDLVRYTKELELEVERLREKGFG